eukprot:4009705-Pleurochrysis_carterae.AAC.1
MMPPEGALQALGVRWQSARAGRTGRDGDGWKGGEGRGRARRAGLGACAGRQGPPCTGGAGQGGGARA